MKNNSSISYITLIYKNKLHFSHLMCMRFIIAILCCMMIAPAMTYAQNDAEQLQIEYEQYTLKRTGEVLVKVFGEIEFDRFNVPAISLSHTNTDGESITHNVMMNEQGYYEFYFAHNWLSERGDYGVVLMLNDIPISAKSYELIQDPSYKTDEEVKEEYYNKQENLSLTVTDERPRFLEFKADAIEGSKTITVIGNATSITNPVIITVLSPNNNLVSIDQITPESNGSFTSTISIGGPLWKQDGVYTITAQQGSDTINKSSAEVEIVDGAVVPEFGAIASLVLIVAISSIIVLSTKSRLRF